ncbi:MAG: hypothetical protein AAF699_15880 [Pseudomonadota bacterium]
MKRLFDLEANAAKQVMQALMSVTRAQGQLPLHPIHRDTLHALEQHVLRSGVDIDNLGSELPNGLAAELPDEDLRRTVIHLAVVLPFLESEHQQERAATLQALAKSLNIKDMWVDDAQRAAKGHYLRLALHCMREVRTLTNSTLRSELTEIAKSALRIDEDAETQAQYAALESLPADSMGRELLRYYSDNGFERPGDAGSWQSRLFFNHDIAHVLGGYDTSPQGEFGVEAFIAGSTSSDLVGYAALIMFQFQIDVAIDPTVPSWKDQFDPDIYFQGLEHGVACSFDLGNPELEAWPMMGEPLGALRERLGLPPEGVMVRSLNDLWCGSMGPPKDRVSPDRRPSKIG